MGQLRYQSPLRLEGSSGAVAPVGRVLERLFLEEGGVPPATNVKAARGRRSYCWGHRDTVALRLLVISITREPVTPIRMMVRAALSSDFWKRADEE